MADEPKITPEGLVIGKRLLEKLEKWIDSQLPKIDESRECWSSVTTHGYTFRCIGLKGHEGPHAYSYNSKGIKLSIVWPL